MSLTYFGDFVPEPPPSTLAELADVNIGDAETGTPLVFDQVTEMWTASEPVKGETVEIDNAGFSNLSSAELQSLVEEVDEKLDDPSFTVGVNSPFVPRAGAIRETIPRYSIGSNIAITSGQIYAFALHLEEGDVISAIEFLAANAPTSPTNQWFGLADEARNVLRLTNDDTTTAWVVNTAKKLNLSSPYTVPSSGTYYALLMVAAGANMALQTSYAGSSTANALTPVIAFRDTTNTGRTTPASAPATLAAVAVTLNAIGWASLS